jgi:murein DD-endopeptidase MepM/ murein hydrolase activator NlpD
MAAGGSSVFRSGASLLMLALAACATQSPRQDPATETAHALEIELPTSVSQGALVIGHTDPASIVTIAGRGVRVSPDGRFAFGIGRDASGESVVSVQAPGAMPVDRRIAIVARDWPVERIAGVPPATVNPPSAIAERIEREQADVSAARVRDDARDDYQQAFIWPVRGRISGRFGNQRMYVLPDGSEVPKAPHSGMDIAAAQGTPVQAPASGVITFAAPDLYLTGGTVLLDHGHGVSSNFLHLSRIDVHVGQRIEQGQVIGAVGATGRASGPHLHWGMNWFDVRVDPLLVVERSR